MNFMKNYEVIEGTAKAEDRSAQPPFGEFRDVRKVFDIPGEDPLVAIENVSFTLEQGKLVSLLGPSGCGKTTFLRIVAGLTNASEGTVQVRGEDVLEPHPDFSFMFQTPNLMPWRTVIENVLFPMEILKKKDQQSRNRAMELLDLTGLQGFDKVRPAQLSGGMQQRVALCRALIHQPKLMLMDEPFGALDELTRMEMHDLLLDIRKIADATVMFVTHSISEAAYLSDTILVFSRRPAIIADCIDVDLPYPRTSDIRYTPKFNEIEHRAGVALGIAK